MHQYLTAVIAALLLLITPGCAADRHLKRAHAALASGDAPSAQHHFEQALHHRDKLAQDNAFRESLRVATRDAEMTHGQTAMSKQQWATAADHFDAALSNEPNFYAAVQARHRAGSLAAPALYDAAIERADLNDLPAARRFLTEALRLSPDHKPAAHALASLNEPFPFTEQEHLAIELTSQKDWSQSIHAWTQAVAESPHRLPARAQLHTTRSSAADDLVKQARTALDQGQPDVAEQRFRAAGTYRPGDHRIKVGLRDADVLRGDQHLANQQPGHAFLAYHRAHQIQPQTDSIRDAMDAAVQALKQNHAGLITIAPPAAEQAPEIAAHQNALIRQTQQQIANAADGWVGALPLQTATPETPNVTVSLANISVNRPQPTTHQRQFAYDVQYTVPNPRLPGLRVELHRLQDCIVLYSRNEDNIQRQLFRARQRNDHHRCDQLERQLRKIRRDLRDARQQRNAVSHAIHNEPIEIIKTRTEHWPYTLETHTQTGRIAGQWQRHDAPPQPFAGDYRDSDDVVLDANPSIGLQADPLQLKSDNAVKAALISRAAHELARRIASIERENHARRLADHAESIHDDPDAATEFRVASILAMSDDETAANAALSKLTQDALLPLPASE